VPSLTVAVASLAGWLGAIQAPQAQAVDPHAKPWCAPEIESLPGDVCYLDGDVASEKNHRRTLVVFLHGAVAKNTTWQWNHMRGMVKLAKGDHVDILFPRSPKSDVGFVWPGSVESQEKVEQGLVDQWINAKHVLESRAGKKYDEVFVMGFSSGAYFVSSLAMRGRLDVDGYAAFAGGQGLPSRPAPVEHFAPVYVGVCSKDEGSAGHSRAFAGALSAAGIPRAVGEQPVGHGLSHVHFNSALAYLRHMKKH
jgi:predicted esterase